MDSGQTLSLGPTHIKRTKRLPLKRDLPEGTDRTLRHSPTDRICHNRLGKSV